MCRRHFPPIETRLHLRTTIEIERTGIDIGPAESVTVVDGVEISAEARACIMAAFRRSAKALPAFPDDVQSFHGPYDHELSVIGVPDATMHGGFIP